MNEAAGGNIIKSNSMPLNLIIIRSLTMESDIKSLWARIIFSAMRNIDRIISSYDRKIDCLAMQGGINRINYMSTQTLLNKIIDCIYMRQGLSNLKAIYNGVIAQMNPNYVKLLKLKFIKNRKFHEIASELNISIRTVFRHYDKALNQFGCVMKLNGYNDEWLEREYGKDPYIDKIKNKVYEEYRDPDKAQITKRCNNLRKMLDNISVVLNEEIKVNL